jgi:hypothetical protein
VPFVPEESPHVTHYAHPAVMHIRATLEARFPRQAASSILFEALALHGGPVPQTMEEIRALVNGALARTLSAHVGDGDARTMVHAIETLLEKPPPAMLTPPPETGDRTRTVPTASRPVDVAVIAGGRAFADRLALVLGPRRVAPRQLSDPRLIASSKEPPAIVVLDATDFTASPPDVIARVLLRLPVTTVRAIWAAELPYGRSLSEVLSRSAVPHSTLHRSEGIEPLLDLIRARRAS